MRDFRYILILLALYLATTAQVKGQTIEVWPGDVDNNGEVNNIDLIYLGAGFNQQGPIRDSIPSIAWGAQQATPWNGFIFTSMSFTNLTFADCDGSGFIDISDVAAIDQNYKLTHGIVQQDSFPIGGPLDPPLFITNHPDSIFDSDTVRLKVNLGSASIPVTDFFGVAFTIEYDTNAVKEALVTATLSEDFANSGISPLIVTQNNAQAGSLDVAISLRANSGGFVDPSIDFDGEILSITFIIEDNLFGIVGAPDDLELHFTKFKGMKYNLEDIALNASDVSIPFKTSPASVSARTLNIDALRVYPNPTQGALHVKGLNGLATITLLGITGEVVYELTTNEPNAQLNTSNLPAGMYLLHLQTEAGVLTKKISVTK